MTQFRDKNVGVVGIGASGLAASRLLRALGACVSVTENSDSPALREAAGRLASEEISVELGGHSRSWVRHKDLIVVSPGVRPDADPLRWAREEGLDVISEIELAYRLCPATLIAITGTNGKTTTTTLTAEVLRAAGHKVFTVGNIGSPFSEHVLAMRPGDFVCLEISSFQLETIRTFRPKVAVILNFSPDHLDRYADIKFYFEAKKRIYENQQSGDSLLLNARDDTLRRLRPPQGVNLVFFNPSPAAGLNENQSAVVSIAKIFGIPQDFCLGVFAGFGGVEHRLESVRDFTGVEFINDSKATNVSATQWALKNIHKPIVLIAGGRDKGADFSEVMPQAQGKVKFAVLVGEAKDRIAAAFKRDLPFAMAQDLRSAVLMAQREAKSGDCVLLSPMCASFDMFKNFEERGKVFKEIVRSLC